LVYHKRLEMIFVGLFIILAIVLIAPFSVKVIEEELEIFLLMMGCIAVTVTSQWSRNLMEEALIEPVKITLAVFVAGFLFRFLQELIAHNVNRIAQALGVKLFAFLVIVGLGFLSSVITAIIAALVLVEIITCLKLDRKHEVFLVILACFSIGFGAALTPIGEPLSTIAIAKLKSAPYYADFFFLLRHLWFFIVPGVILFGLLGAILMPRELQKIHGLEEKKKENIKDIFLRAVKVYFFVVALVFLGKGFKPIVDMYVLRIPHQGLYWLNMFSAVLDNATLAAAEISPSMSLLQIKSALLGLLIAGGMLIPGNIPNIICAGKLKIKSSEWAKFGIPLGLVIMTAYFFLIILVR
jgi:predicted cation transporter